MPDGIFQRPIRLNAAEVLMRETMGTMGRTLTPYRAGVTTDGVKHNQYRSRCFGRGACNRRSGGCDIHAAFDSPTGLIYPANDTGNLTIRTNATVREVSVDATTGRARGVSFLDSTTGRVYEARAKVVVLAASTLESTRLLLLSKSALHPNGIGNSSGVVGQYSCEHLMGPSVLALVKDLVGKPRTLDDGRPGAFYYTSKIGIHQEMEYKGNTLLQEFVGQQVQGRSRCKGVQGCTVPGAGARGAGARVRCKGAVGPWHRPSTRTRAPHPSTASEHPHPRTRTWHRAPWTPLHLNPVIPLFL